jgi:hypothetical protein
MDPGGEVAKAMHRELRVVPLKLAGEFVLYSLVAVFVAATTRMLFRRTTRVLLRSAGVGLIVSVAVLCLEAPLSFSYGTSMWSTWAGPGAFGFSFGHMAITMAPAETIAHRFVLEALNLGATHVVDLVANPLTYIDIWIEPAQTWFVLALRSAAVYALFAFLVTALASILRRLIRPQSVAIAA